MAVIDIPLPRLLDDSGNFVRTVRPIKVSINLNITPLSYASIELPKGENIPARGYVELFTPMGSAGIFRVRSPSDAYGDYITTAELEHAVTEVADYLVLNDYNEMMAAGTAMQTIFSHYRGNRWRLGSVAALGTGQIAVTANHVRVLEAMLALLEQKPDCMMAFDFSTSPWTINIVSRGTTVTAEGRLARNVNFAKINYDDTELCTRAYYEVETTTGPDGEPSSEWRHVDASTINTYGVVEREVYTGTGITSAEALIAVNAFLDKHKDPRVAIEISAEELSSITGESLDAFEIGKLFRLALVDYNNLIVEQNITGLSWDSVYENPYDVTVYLAEPEDTVINFLHDLDTNGGTMGGSGGGSTSASLGTGGGGGGGGARKKQEDAWKEYYTRFQQTDYFLDLTAVHVDRNNNILQQAGMYIDSQGVLQYAEDNERQIAGKLKLTAESLTSDYTQKIGDTEAALQGTITQTASSLRSDYTDKINNTESHITQTASEIRTEVEDKENGLKSEIKQTADAVEINAQNIKANASSISLNAKNIKIIADDYVTINKLSTELQAIKSAYAEKFSGDLIQGNTVSGGVVNANDSLNVYSTHVKWCNAKVDGTQVAQFLGTADINFDRAAAKAEGAAAVTLSSQGWQSGGRNVVTASNGKSYTVNLPSFSTSGGTTWTSDHKTTVYFSTASVSGPLASVVVDASSIAGDEQAAYKRGWTAGVGYAYNHTHLNGNVITGPNESGTGTETWYTITAGVGGEWTASGGFSAHGYAYVNNSQVASAHKTFS